MEDFSLASSPEGEDESGKAINKACDLCRKKKIRCHLMPSDCVQCIKYNVHCIFSPIKKKVGPRKPPGYKHVEELEGRLKKMEAMLLSLGGAIELLDDDSERGHQEKRPKKLDKKRKASPGTLSSSESCNSRQRARTRSSPTSSRTGGNPSPYEDINTPSDELDVSLPYWRLNTVSDVVAQRSFKPLPPKDDARLLVLEAFQSFNAIFPIYDPFTFLSLFEARYGNNDRADPGWWASINAVLALAHRFRAMRILNSEAEDAYAWGYLQNALAMVTKLTMLKPELIAVQAILAMAIILQGTPNPGPCSVLISIVLKLAHSMKLHRKTQDTPLSVKEIQQRKRVFWIAYMLDKDISSRTEDPPVQDDDDMDVDLPDETIDLCSMAANGVNFFNLRIGLAIIQGQVYKRLSSTKALKQPDAERMLIATELDVLLEGWKQSVPDEFTSIGYGMIQAASTLNTIIHSTVLKFIYFDTLQIIHRALTTSVGTLTKPGTRQARSQALSINVSSDSVCLNEARRSLQLFPKVPQGNYACTWIVLHHACAAAGTILSHIISNPTHSAVDDDFKLIEPLLRLLKKLKEDEKEADLEKMDITVTDMWVGAVAAVELVKGRRAKGLVKGNDDTRIEERYNVNKDINNLGDFIQRIELLSADKCKVFDREKLG